MKDMLRYLFNPSTNDREAIARRRHALGPVVVGVAVAAEDLVRRERGHPPAGDRPRRVGIENNDAVCALESEAGVSVPGDLHGRSSLCLSTTDCSMSAENTQANPKLLLSCS